MCRLVAEAMASPALICDTEQWKALQVRELVVSLALRGFYALIRLLGSLLVSAFTRGGAGARRRDPEVAPAGPDDRRWPLQGNDGVGPHRLCL
jgi:hypothetical protein